MTRNAMEKTLTIKEFKVSYFLTLLTVTCRYQYVDY